MYGDHRDLHGLTLFPYTTLFRSGGEGPSPVMRSAFLGLCPQCGEQTIFGTHIVRFEPRCRGCGLDYSQFNVGDGPAAFLILIVGAIITALALVEIGRAHV